MIWIGYLICTLISIVILMGLFFLIKKDTAWLDYVNVISKSDMLLDRKLLADLVRKMLAEVSLLLILNTFIIFILSSYSQVNDFVYSFIYVISFFLS